jgi:hypothetical protein
MIYLKYYVFCILLNVRLKINIKFSNVSEVSIAITHGSCDKTVSNKMNVHISKKLNLIRRHFALPDNRKTHSCWHTFIAFYKSNKPRM